MRNITFKFVLPAGLLVASLCGLVLYRNYCWARKHIQDMADHQAALALEFDLAIRNYVKDELRPIVSELAGPDCFIPEAMSSSFVARAVFERVRQRLPDYVIKFSSDSPRNPINRAGPDELRMIDHFRANPNLERWTGQIELDGKPYLAHLAARRMEESCLRCHGDPADAPAALVERYGATAGFHRPLGEVIGMDTIAVPLSHCAAEVGAQTTRSSLILMVGVALCFAGLMLVFRLMVARRLSRITAHFEQLVAEPDLPQVPEVRVAGKDEISRLAGNFNALARRLSTLYTSLEQRVRERTEELSQLNARLEQQVEDCKRAEAAAQAASQAKTLFLANMSHEIRTPMTAIIGYSDLLNEELQACAQCQDCGVCPTRGRVFGYVETICSNGRHLLELVNDVLDLSKVEVGQVLVERVPCEPCQIIHEVASLMRARAAAKNLELRIEYEGPIPQVIQTDPTRLRQILINLVGNAVKFTPAGSVRLITRLVRDSQPAGRPTGRTPPDSTNPASATSDRPGPTPPQDRRDPGPSLQFDIIDTGIGISSEQAAKLFEPFTQADISTTRRFGGTGLGLAISQRLAQLLGGHVELVSSQPGSGSHFRLTIPTGPLADVPMVDDPQAATSVVRESSRSEDTRPLQLRVLLAEDGVDNQRLIIRLLEKAGAKVTAVDNGQQAVGAALRARDRSEPFDAIVLDMQMPVMDGCTAAGLLRQSGYRGPIIALTAHATSQDRQKCLQAGCDDYLTKPVSRSQLIETLRRWCQPAESAAG